MQLEFNEEEKMLQKAARDFARKELEPFLARYPEAPLPREAVMQILKMVKPFGMLSARVPAGYGGEPISHIALGILAEEFPAEVTMDANGNDVLALRVYHGGSEEIKRKYLPRLAEGEIMAGSCISEPDAGSDITSIITKAELVNNEYYLVNGTKIWSSHGHIADVVLAAVSMGKDARGRTILGRLLIDREQSSFKSRDVEMTGLKKHHLSECVFEDCRVPKGNYVGDPGDGVKMFTLSWLSQRPLLGLIALHIAREAFEASISYAKERKQFGKPIGAFQLVQDMIVEMATLIETSRYLCYKTLYLLDKGEPARLESSMAKYYATEAAVKVTTMAIQIHGSYGLSTESKLEKLFRDARMFTIPDGTTEIQKLQVGRELLGISAIR